MIVVKEDSKRITLEMSKEDFNHLRNIFVFNKDFCDNELNKNEYELAKKIVHLEDTEKGLFDAIKTLAEHSRNTRGITAKKGEKKENYQA